jgi:hypothetical protein
MLSKKEIRRQFRKACLKRDKLTCVKCGLKAFSFEDAEKLFDVHHITDRSLMPYGGYVLENGITLCEEDHIKAEVFHSTGIPVEGYSPDDLYKIINSNLEKAIKASEKLKS